MPLTGLREAFASGGVPVCGAAAAAAAAPSAGAMGRRRAGRLSGTGEKARQSLCRPSAGHSPCGPLLGLPSPRYFRAAAAAAADASEPETQQRRRPRSRYQLGSCSREQQQQQQRASGAASSLHAALPPNGSAQSRRCRASPLRRTQPSRVAAGSGGGVESPFLKEALSGMRGAVLQQAKECKPPPPLRLSAARAQGGCGPEQRSSTTQVPRGDVRRGSEPSIPTGENAYLTVLEDRCQSEWTNARAFL